VVTQSLGREFWRELVHRFFYLFPLFWVAYLKFVLSLPFSVSELPHIHGDGASAERLDYDDGFPPLLAVEYGRVVYDLVEARDG